MLLMMETRGKLCFTLDYTDVPTTSFTILYLTLLFIVDEDISCTDITLYTAKQPFGDGVN